ncbi:protein angel homolog 2 [Odontomachus brunneus]|uniref:protein angel homolog 2 n=1 Tax=Odontomachus brunneus TaxID=486640 RepID=UPI0013F27A8A|nr:protein angel homolog 2 [Odontomachus brunneus]
MKCLFLSYLLHIFKSESIRNVDYVICKARDRTFLQSWQIVYMLRLSRSLLRTLYKGISTSMGNPVSVQECKRPKMDPYLNSCYNQNNASAMCSIPFNTASDNAIYCPSDTYETSYGVKANVCRTSANCLPGNQAFDRQRYNTIRKWKRFGKGKPNSNAENYFTLRLLSFNILAQNLLETHSYLYKDHDPAALSWVTRKPLVLQEIFEAEANIICLQEVLEDHLLDFVAPFRELEYEYLYKRRTNDKKDGLLLLYRGDQFTLLDYAKVELYQSGVDILNRDNVGIIAKLSLRDSPETQIVVATTHLLYNPRRNDVRLAQTQLLLAEIERIAFIENTQKGPKYLPIILAGDFNLTPFSAVYKFLTEGSFEYYGKGRNLEPSEYHSLPNSLIPPRLCVTDNCQHFNVLTQRLRKEGNGRVMLENSESVPQRTQNTHTSCSTSGVNINTSRMQVIKITEDHLVKFSSGILTHPFDMRSVYTHANAKGEMEATTHQDEWITVDYIFYSNIQPVEKYILPTVNQCTTLPTIPNFVVGSDHLSIGATFRLSRKKSPL